jgi:hypothetical protein
VHLTLSPQMGLPGQPEMTIHVAGDVITLDGEAFDLSPVPEGGEGWPDETTSSETPFIGPIRRIDGVIHATLIARLGDTAAPDQGGPWVIPDAEGDVIIPAARKPEPEPEDSE